MLSREEIRLLNEILGDLCLSEEREKLQKKIKLICEQLDIMEQAQKDAGRIQEEIQKLDGDEDGKKED